jgi:hypothetical protein
MLAGATEKLKKQMGWAAYVLSALRHLADRPARVRLRADSGPPRRRWGCVKSNWPPSDGVGWRRLKPDWPRAAGWASSATG